MGLVVRFISGWLMAVIAVLLAGARLAGRVGLDSGVLLSVSLPTAGKNESNAVE